MAIINIPDEDARFLANLAHELRTQPTDGNRAPRYWTINGLHYMWGMDREYADGWQVYDCESACDVGAKDDMGSVIVTLVDEYGYAPEIFAECENIEDVVAAANEDSAEGVNPFDVHYYTKHYHAYPDCMFITKRACEEHIRKYGYNYTEPHTYVMTADRSPEYERLLEVLMRVEWGGHDEKNEN